MKAQEMADKIKNDPTFDGLDIFVDERWGTVDVNGFGATADWKATKAKLEELGFSCGPNFGRYEEPEFEPGPARVVEQEPESEPDRKYRELRESCQRSAVGGPERYR